MKEHPIPPTKGKSLVNISTRLKKSIQLLYQFAGKLGVTNSAILVYTKERIYPSPGSVPFHYVSICQYGSQNSLLRDFPPSFPRKFSQLLGVSTITTFPGTNTQLSQTNCRDNDLHDSFHIVTQLFQFPAYLR